MQITIMGSGGTGAYYGAKLARAGYDVTFVARGAHLEAMKSRGLQIVGQEEMHLPQVRAVSSVSHLPPADVVVFAVKTYDTEEAVELIRPIVGPKTMILPLQNGIDSYNRIGAVVGHERVIGGLCRISVEIKAPGIIQLNSPFGEIIFGEMDGSPSRRTADLAAALERAEIIHRIASDIRVQLWKKFIFITAISGVNGATRSPIGPIRATPETFALYNRIASEVTLIAAAEGVAIDPGYPDELMSQARSMAAGIKASLLVDLERGHRTEVETLQGAVLRLGQKHGIRTPVTEVVYALIKMHRPA